MLQAKSEHKITRLSALVIRNSLEIMRPTQTWRIFLRHDTMRLRAPCSNFNHLATAIWVHHITTTQSTDDLEGILVFIHRLRDTVQVWPTQEQLKRTAWYRHNTGWNIAKVTKRTQVEIRSLPILPPPRPPTRRTWLLEAAEDVTTRIHLGRRIELCTYTPRP